MEPERDEEALIVVTDSYAPKGIECSPKAHALSWRCAGGGTHG